MLKYRKTFVRIDQRLEILSNSCFSDTNGKSTNSKKDNVNWQLSAKGNGDKNQYQLDAGQKNFGATQCTECGIVYQVGDPEDENAHLNYHNNRKTLKFPVCNIYIYFPYNIYTYRKRGNTFDNDYRVGKQNV